MPTQPPGILPSWAVPAIEGVPEAVQAASKAVTRAAKDAKESLQSVVAAGASSDVDKVQAHLPFCNMSPVHQRAPSRPLYVVVVLQMLTACA